MIYIVYLGFISSQCETYVFPNTPPHAQYYWAWCMTNLKVSIHLF